MTHLGHPHQYLLELFLAYLRVDDLARFLVNYHVLAPKNTGMTLDFDE
jgi:hypothetical protein